jgi:predicted aspartyl protease
MAGLVIFFGSLAHAADFAYKWRDKYGDVHITGSKDSIPLQYRNSAKKIPVIELDDESITTKRYQRAIGSAHLESINPVKGMVVEAKFNGKVIRKAMVDTGSERLIISSRLARALGYSLDGTLGSNVSIHGEVIKGALVRIDRVELGGAAVYGIEAVAFDFDERNSLSAIVGMDFLDAFEMEFTEGVSLKLSRTAD